MIVNGYTTPLGSLFVIIDADGSAALTYLRNFRLAEMKNSKRPLEKLNCNFFLPEKTCDIIPLFEKKWESAFQGKFK